MCIITSGNNIEEKQDIIPISDMCFLDMREMGSCSVLNSRAGKGVRANSCIACRANAMPLRV